MLSSLGLLWGWNELLCVCVKLNAWHKMRSKIQILQIFTECWLHRGTVLGTGGLIFFNGSHLLYFLTAITTFSLDCADQLVSFLLKISSMPTSNATLHFSNMHCLLFESFRVWVSGYTPGEHKLLKEKRSQSRHVTEQVLENVDRKHISASITCSPLDKSWKACESHL